MWIYLGAKSQKLENDPIRLLDREHLAGGCTLMANVSCSDWRDWEERSLLLFPGFNYRSQLALLEQSVGNKQTANIAKNTPKCTNQGSGISVFLLVMHNAK